MASVPQRDLEAAGGQLFPARCMGLPSGAARGPPDHLLSLCFHVHPLSGRHMDSQRGAECAAQRKEEKQLGLGQWLWVAALDPDLGHTQPSDPHFPALPTEGFHCDSQAAIGQLQGLSSRRPCGTVLGKGAQPSAPPHGSVLGGRAVPLLGSGAGDHTAECGWTSQDSGLGLHLASTRSRAGVLSQDHTFVSNSSALRSLCLPGEGSELAFLPNQVCGFTGGLVPGTTHPVR